LNAEHSFGEHVVSKVKTIAHKTKDALHKAAHSTKDALNNTAHKVADSNVTKAVVNGTKHAVNVTIAVAQSALNKTSTWIKGLVSNHHLNVEEKQTLAQKIAEKSKALLNKAKTEAGKLRNKITGHENHEHHFGEQVMTHVKHGGVAVKKAAEVAKNTLTNVWNKLAQF